LLPGCIQVAAAIPHAPRVDRVGRSPTEDEMNSTITKLALVTVAAGLLVPVAAIAAAGVGFDWVWVYGPVSGFLGTLALAGAVLISPRPRHAAVHL
jgi:hypothetical protein